MKNVAGFDLTRLVTGAWGTLGALTEITVRLRARPEVDMTFAVNVADADTAWRFTRATEYKPFAAELVSPSLAQRLTGSPDARLLVRLGGNASFVSAAQSAVLALGSVQPVASSVWNELALAEPPGAVVFRVSTLPSNVGVLFALVTGMAEPLGGFTHATLTRGVVRCVLPSPGDNESFEHLRSALSAFSRDFTIVGERMPVALWNVIARAGSTAALADGVRRAFDPDRIMNPGILEGA
ncbi:MAG: hypothetical protein ABI969_06170 [bacterium]